MNKINIKIIFIVLLPILFYAAVKFAVENVNVNLCLFRIITGKECIGCGITRAFYELFNLNFEKACEYNSRIIIVAPLMFLVWIKMLIENIKIEKGS